MMHQENTGSPTTSSDTPQKVIPELNWRLLVYGGLICVVGAASTPYVTLKLGQSVDMSLVGMFMMAAIMGRYMTGSRLAVQMNLIQTMIGTVGGVGFMCVILAAFYYIQDVFHRDIGFNPTWLQLSLWLMVSANLGVFTGALTRRFILSDQSLPWPGGVAVLGVIEPLTDPEASETNDRKRKVLKVGLGWASLFTLLRDSFGVIPTVAPGMLNMSFGFEFVAIGIGMLVPLAVGLTGLVGVWAINTFGETVAQLGSLGGVAPEVLGQCRDLMAKGEVTEFVKSSCGDAAKFMGAHSHFGFMVKWFMWPATAMMVTASLTSVLVPLIRNALKKRRGESISVPFESKADEHMPMRFVLVGMLVCIVLLTWLQSAWFDMPWEQVFVAVAVSPLLIIAGARVMALTGNGPVSLMANFTQFIFGLIWPNHVKQNLNAAHVAADGQASSEGTISSFWVGQRVGGSFKNLLYSQLIVIPLACLVVPLVFQLLLHTYGIGSESGQLSAPTALKIASLALVMEKGTAALPPGALTVSIIAAVIGIVFELLLMVPKNDAEGKYVGKRFWWVPIPAVLGFSLILPPTLSIGTAIGCVITASWKAFAGRKGESHDLYCAPLAAGLIGGEAVVGGVVVPVISSLMEVIKPLL